MSTHIIKTSRLYLSEFSEKDASGFYEMNNNPTVLRYTGDAPFASIEDAKAFIQSYDHYKKHIYGRWTIRRITDDAYLGFCGLKYHAETEEVDLGYRIDQKYWGNGYATEAAQACLNYGLNELELNRIIGRVEVENKASIRVLEKIGMRYVENFDFDGKIGAIYDKIK